MISGDDEAYNYAIFFKLCPPLCCCFHHGQRYFSKSHWKSRKDVNICKGSRNKLYMFIIARRWQVQIYWIEFVLKIFRRKVLSRSVSWLFSCFSQPWSLTYYIITLRIQAISLVDSRDLLQDMQTHGIRDQFLNVGNTSGNTWKLHRIYANAKNSCKYVNRYQ